MRISLAIIFSAYLFLCYSLHAQNKPKTKVPPQIQQQSCISDSEKEKLDYVKNTQCFEERTFSEINAKKARVPKTTDLPSCEEIVFFAHQVNVDSHNMPIVDFDKKYLDEVKNRSRNPLSTNHPFFSKKRAVDPNNNLTKEENVLLDVIATEASNEIIDKLKSEIKILGFEKAKEKFKGNYGVKTLSMLSVESIEEFLMEFKPGKIKAIILKNVVDPSLKSKIPIEVLSEMTLKISSKVWLKESISVLKNPTFSRSYSLFKIALSNIKIGLPVSFLTEFIVTHAISLFAQPESFNWAEDQDDESSFINRPEFFSAFAANSNFKIGKLSCSDIYLKFCNYYYSFACQKGTGFRDRIRTSFLENYISQRSKNVHIEKAQDELDIIAEKNRFIMQRESTNIVIKPFLNSTAKPTATSVWPSIGPAVRHE